MSDAAARAAELAEKKLSPPIEVADARPPAFSEDALAQRFAERHGKDLRYIAAWSHWYAWAGARWGLESTLDAFDRARAICRVAASEADKPGLKIRLTAAKTVAAVERLAKADRRLAATSSSGKRIPTCSTARNPRHDDRPPHRGTVRTAPGRLVHQAFARRCPRRLPALADLSRPRHGWRRGVASLSRPGLRLLVDRAYARACPFLPVRHGRQRQERVH